MTTMKTTVATTKTTADSLTVGKMVQRAAEIIADLQSIYGLLEDASVPSIPKKMSQVKAQNTAPAYAKTDDSAFGRAGYAMSLLDAASNVVRTSDVGDSWENYRLSQQLWCAARCCGEVLPENRPAKKEIGRRSMTDNQFRQATFDLRLCVITMEPDFSSYNALCYGDGTIRTYEPGKIDERLLPLKLPTCKNSTEFVTERIGKPCLIPVWLAKDVVNLKNKHFAE